MFSLRVISYFMSLFSPGRGERLSSLYFCVRGTAGEHNVYEETEVSPAVVFTGGDSVPGVGRGHLTMCGHILGDCQNRKEMLLVPSGAGAGMLLAVLLGAGRPP